MLINSYKFDLTSFHKRNLNLALLNFILKLKDFSPNINCNLFNFSYGIVKKKLYTVVKPHHIHKKSKKSFALLKYKSTVKIDIILNLRPKLATYANFSGLVKHKLNLTLNKKNSGFYIFFISEYIKILIKTCRLTPYVSILFNKNLHFN